MADTKISELTEKTTPAAGDYSVLVDQADGSDKKFDLSNYLSCLIPDPATDLTFSGIIIATTARASITAGDWVYMGTDGVYKAEGDAATHCPAVGIATQTKGVGESIIVGRLGKWRNDALTLTVGSVGAGILWLSPTTAGADVQAADPNTIYDTNGQIAQQLGWAHSATIKFVAPDNTTVTKGDTPLVSGGALGTPASGTLTNCSGLPLSGVVDSTSEALGVGTLELGHASDTTLARSAAGVVTIEGKPVRMLVTGTVTDSATPYPSSDGTTNGTKVNFFTVTALAQAAELQAPKGTWAVGEELVIAITGDATPRALTYVAGGTYIAAATTPGALPTTTVASKTIVMKFICNATTPTFWYVGYAGAF